MRPPDAERGPGEALVPKSFVAYHNDVRNDTSGLVAQLVTGGAKADRLGSVLAAAALGEIDVDPDLVVELLRAVDGIAQHFAFAEACAR